MPKQTSLFPDSQDEFFRNLKKRIRSTQVKAALAVNRELFLLYWHIGKEILQRHQEEGWVAKAKERLANEIAVLIVVMQRPHDLIRQQLKELKLLLDRSGYSETALQTAWRDTTNQDIAASIIEFIRQATLGDALIPYGERVDRAMKKILDSRPWTDIQRQWLEQIGKQLRAEVIVDREALDKGEFKSQGGGFDRLNKTFNGQLETILQEIGDRLWQQDVG